MKKILLIRTEHIGDYVLTLPALKSIREKYPKAKIDIIVGPWNEPLAKATPYVDEVIVFNNPLVERNIKKSKIAKELSFGIIKYLRLFRRLNKRNYDLLISFNDRKYGTFFCNNIKAKKKIDANKFSFGEINERERTLLILNENQIPSSKNTNLKISKKEKKNVDKFLKKEKIKDFHIIHPLSPDPLKNWPIINWIELTKKFSNEKFIFIGSASERELIGKCIEFNNSNKNCYNLCGSLNLLETYYLISKAKSFLSINSGPMYMADIQETPILVLFSRNHTKVPLWRPVSKNSIVLSKKNVYSIKTKEVFNSFKKLLKK